MSETKNKTNCVMKKIKVHFVTRKGETETVEVPEYNTLMEASRYYSKAITIMDVDQLGEVLLNELSEIFQIN